MKIVKLKSKIDAQGRLSLEIPTFLNPGPVEVVMVIQPEPDENPASPGYDFSALTGQLTWQDDALAAQKALRNEWD